MIVNKSDKLERVLSGSSGLGLNPCSGQRHCVVFLSLTPQETLIQIYKWVPTSLMLGG